MDISPITATTAATGTSSASAVYDSQKSAFGTDSFLRLLVAQLQNQDPLDPQDSTEFISQLAQLNTVEQLNNVNSNLEVLQLYQSSLNNAMAVGYIGKMVQANGHAVEIGAGGSATLEFSLSEAAADVTIEIYDSAGRMVRSIEAGALGQGDQAVDWDGLDANGDPVAAGVYTFKVNAHDAGGNALDTSAWVEGVVTGVEFKNGIAYLVTAEHLIPLGSVVKILQAPEE